MCSLGEVYGRFEGTYSLHITGIGKKVNLSLCLTN
jgi:hypothetical protein